jgi:hypothetical protein
LFAGDLKALTETPPDGGKPLLSPNALRCPFLPDREVGYFYYGPATGPEAEGSPEQLQACELSHPEQGGRIVMFTDRGEPKWIAEGEFRRLLKLDLNKSFAEALEEAEQK